MLAALTCCLWQRKLPELPELPPEVQALILGPLSLRMFQKGDRALQLHMLKHGMVSDHQAVLCRAAGQRDRWLAKRVLASGATAGVHTLEAFSRAGWVDLVEVGIAVDTETFQVLLDRGDVCAAVALHRQGATMPSIPLNTYDLVRKVHVVDLPLLLATWPDLLRDLLWSGMHAGRVDVIEHIIASVPWARIEGNGWWSHGSALLSLLENALKNKHAHIALLLWAAAPDPVLPQEKAALFAALACSAGGAEELEFVLDHADGPCPQALLDACLLRGAAAGRRVVVETLLGRGANPNAGEGAARCAAATAGHVDVYDLLRDAARSA